MDGIQSVVLPHAKPTAFVGTFLSYFSDVLSAQARGSDKFRAGRKLPAINREGGNNGGGQKDTSANHQNWSLAPVHALMGVGRGGKGGSCPLLEFEIVLF